MKAATISHRFPQLTSLSLSSNALSSITQPISASVKELILDYNDFVTLSSLSQLTNLPNLTRLSLRGNNIDRITSSLTPNEAKGKTQDGQLVFSTNLSIVDISMNKIDHWSFIDSLPSIFPGLISLRVSDNPLYDRPVAPSRITNLPERPMTVEEAYMLTLSRLAQLTTLNFSNITSQDRNNGELYYLSLIRKELSASPKNAEQQILAKNPRYSELCDIYEQQEIKRADDNTDGKANIQSLATRLLAFTFYLATPSASTSTLQAQIKEHRKEIPRSYDVYRVKAIVSHLFSLTPLRFRLIWETEEWDPVDEGRAEDDDWDSGNEESVAEKSPDLDKSQKQKCVDGEKFVRREEELVDSTRDIGFWFRSDIRDARIRVEPF